MTHVLILGMTESGKTTLAKKLSSRYRANGVHTIVLDPLHDPGWSASYQTSDPAQFLDVVKRSQRCAVFIDESGESIGRYNEEMFWLATRSRHYGHCSHFICQRGSMLAKTVRDQCGHLFLFCCSIGDAKTAADEWGRVELATANSLAQGECFSVPRFGELQKLNVFTA